VDLKLKDASIPSLNFKDEKEYIDLLLVSDDFPDDWFKRQAKLYFLKAKQIEPIGYTTTEIRRMMEEGNKFIENVFREGKDIELKKFRVRSVKRRGGG